MPKNILTVIAIILILMLSFHNKAEDYNDALSLANAGKILPLETILSILYKIEKGKVIEVELEGKNKLLTYEIELLTANGIVFKYIFNAETGKLLKSKVDE